MIEPKPKPRPWFALWRGERGSFAQLPLVARALFGEILKLTDDDGVIELGGREPAAAIAWALGADRADRRALEKHVPELLRDGCLVRDGDRLIAPSFARWQPYERKPRTDHEAASNVPRHGHDTVAIGSRTDHETQPNTAESLSAQSLLLRSRVEESRVEGVARPPKKPEVPGPSLSELEQRYPQDVLLDVWAGCGAARGTGRVTDRQKRNALLRLAKHDLDLVLRCMRVYLDRYAGEKDERYVCGIVDNESKRQRNGKVVPITQTQTKPSGRVSEAQVWTERCEFYARYQLTDDDDDVKRWGECPWAALKRLGHPAPFPKPKPQAQRPLPQPEYVGVPRG